VETKMGIIKFIIFASIYKNGIAIKAHRLIPTKQRTKKGIGILRGINPAPLMKIKIDEIIESVAKIMILL
jgi:hypothetical protein